MTSSARRATAYAVAICAVVALLAATMSPWLLLLWPASLCLLAALALRDGRIADGREDPDV